MRRKLWRGIPYAQPPLNSLRFAAPQPLQLPAGSLWDSSSFADICHQVNANTEGQSEDCLYLDVTAPAETTPESRLPVVYWIYGGSFTSGSSPKYESWASNLVSSGEQENKPVITVVANYRTGPWGWLVGQEAQDAGLTNIGLQDQMAALKWIQQNIGQDSN